MMIRPRPQPPYLPIYPELERAGIQARYELDVSEWQRETSRLMWLNAIPVLCVGVGGIMAALMGPQIVVDAIMILAQ